VTTLGSAGVLPPGFGVPPKQTFFVIYMAAIKFRMTGKVREPETAWPARETRALPRDSLADLVESLPIRFN